MAVPATIETRDQSRLSSFTVEHRGRKMYSCDEIHLYPSNLRNFSVINPATTINLIFTRSSVIQYHKSKDIDAFVYSIREFLFGE